MLKSHPKAADARGARPSASMSVSFIQHLAERLQASDPTDAHEQREIFERIRELRSAFDGPLDPESHRRLEAAGMLIAYLARMGDLAGEDVRAIAVRTLRSAADAEAGARAPAGAEAPPSRTPTFPVIGKKPPASASGAALPSAAEGSRSATDLMGDMLLGQILLKRGQILEEHIHQAMKVQRTTSARIGDIFVKIGACSRTQVADALTYQTSLRRVRENLGDPAEAKDKADVRGMGLKLAGEALLGEILIERNVVTRRQLERALEVQKQSGTRIGEALVKTGATTLDQIEQALRFQGRERRFGKIPSEPGKGAGDGKR